MRHHYAKLHCGDTIIGGERRPVQSRTHLLQKFGDIAVEIGIGHFELRHDIGRLASKRHIRDRPRGGRNGRKGGGIRTGIDAVDGIE
jgi:hypothetical protein